ncbi:MULTISPECIES: LuxR C-terminal-related transcriptional regulator [Brevibacterium]|nr:MULTISPECIES: LuxR C-terminal-related transcriptional regulator [Brevibacterium]
MSPEPHRPDHRRAASPADLQQLLGVDEHVARLLYDASGGWVAPARAALDSVAASNRSLGELLGSGSLAEFAIRSGPDVDISLDRRDRLALRTLSLLHRFSEHVAVIALDAVASTLEQRDVDAEDHKVTLLRLQAMGLVLADGEADALHVPALIAAWVRSLSTQDGLVGSSSQNGSATGPGSSLRPADEDAPLARLRSTLVEAFTEQIEFATSPDAVLVENALLLARAGRLWTALGRIASAVGLPVLYLYPESIEAFAHLPQRAVRESPELALLSVIADTVAEARSRAPRAGDTSTGRLRELVARATAPGTPGSREFALLCEPTAPAAEEPPGARIDDSTSSPDPTSAEHPGALIEARDVLARMSQLSGQGRHREAAQVGAGWVSLGAPRPRAIVRFRAAVESVLAGEPGRALALLRDIEDAMQERAVVGDFLAPAIVAWSALASFLGGDHRRAEGDLLRFASLDEPPIVLEAAFRPAALIAAAHRALDRLDLGRLADLVARLKEFPEMGSLWIHVPVLERTLALLSATSESGILLADEEAEVYAQTRRTSEAGAGVLSASRAAALVGLGQLFRAEQLLAELPARVGAKYVLTARSCVVAGRFDDALAVIRSHFYDDFLSTRERAELTGLRAVAHLRSGEEDEAAAAFREAIELSNWVGSLLPIALLPAPDRNTLLDLTPDVWGPVLQEFARDRMPTADLRDLLGGVATALVPSVDSPNLTERERTLLALLGRSRSVSQIAAELHLVEGTVKNNLSALYRKLGASGRESALARARALGYVDPPET